MAAQESSRFLTIKNVAAELATSESQIRAIIASGDLPAIQIGGRGQWRIERAKLEGYIADAYTRTAEALQRGVKLTDEGED
ncbi:helix-turn-helix domain-containing protein [Arthrobacter sp.]|uniref:helix-turn-helix domain-containing protein n=1 Tax=Arthrobacter sp. TaxID=1667 RepID=UPI0028115988|nr:helix-turn-helix domain-containing protein [Arthrobacter sp.]